jgi:hypothetical protein
MKPWRQYVVSNNRGRTMVPLRGESGCMNRGIRFPLIAAFLSCAALIPEAGCADLGRVTVDVLPPRASVTCTAPTLSDPALGRGLLDVAASADAHGAYVADLRLSSKGHDADVTSIEIAYDLPAGAGGAVEDAAEEAAGEAVVGDVSLVGDDDELRRAVLENVELIPRALSLALAADGGLGIDAVEFARIGVTLTPVVEGLEAAPSGFAIDLCAGCLVAPPAACAGDGENARNPVVCRPGQDTPSFTCVTPSGGAP